MVFLLNERNHLSFAFSLSPFLSPRSPFFLPGGEGIIKKSCAAIYTLVGKWYLTLNEQ